MTDPLEKQSIKNTVFSIGQEYMTLDKTNMNFKWVQSIRLVMICIIGSLWLLEGFILVRIAPFYISFWTLSFLFAALLKISLSSGRKVVEGKMLEKLKIEKSEEREKITGTNPENDIHLPKEEVKENWRSGIVLYSIAIPLTWVSMIIFYSTPMSEDIVCQLAAYAASSKDGSIQEYVQTCSSQLADSSTSTSTTYQDTYDSYVATSEWRYPTFIASLWVPLIVGLIDLGLNQIWLKITHVAYCVVVFAAYVFVTVVGQNLLSQPIYYQMLNYYCAENAPGSYTCWQNVGRYLTLFMFLQVAFFLVFWVILFMRHKYFESKTKPGCLL